MASVSSRLCIFGLYGAIQMLLLLLLLNCHGVAKTVFDNLLQNNMVLESVRNIHCMIMDLQSGGR